MKNSFAIENERLRAKINELTDRVIAESTNRVDAGDLKRENADLRKRLAEAPTGEAAVAKLREWNASAGFGKEWITGDAFVAMSTAMASKIIDEIGALESSRDQAATREHDLLAERDEARETAATLLLGIELHVGFAAIKTLRVGDLPAWATPWLNVADDARQLRAIAGRPRQADLAPDTETPAPKRGVTPTPLVLLAEIPRVLDAPEAFRAIPAGTVVYRYDGHTYGTIREPHIAVTLEPGGMPPRAVRRDDVAELTHRQEFDENGHGTGHALCDTGEGLAPHPGGKLSEQAANCPACLGWPGDQPRTVAS
jgi:hypothetical protein